jgi:hypothetical protein
VDKTFSPLSQWFYNINNLIKYFLLQSYKTGTISLLYAIYYQKVTLEKGGLRITETVIQTSSSEDVIKTSSAFLALGRYYRVLPVNSLWFSVSP